MSFRNVNNFQLDPNNTQWFHLFRVPPLIFFLLPVVSSFSYLFRIPAPIFLLQVYCLPPTSCSCLCSHPFLIYHFLLPPSYFSYSYAHLLSAPPFFFFLLRFPRIFILVFFLLHHFLLPPVDFWASRSPFRTVVHSDGGQILHELVSISREATQKHRKMGERQITSLSLRCLTIWESTARPSHRIYRE